MEKHNGIQNISDFTDQFHHNFILLASKKKKVPCKICKVLWV